MTDRTEYMRLYRIKNKESERIKKQKYYQEHKQEKNIKSQQYYQEHKQERGEYQQKYMKTEQGKKTVKISSWKFQGLISDNYDKIYEIYKNTEICDNCDIELNQDVGTRKCMDHDHSNGLFRNILCHTCNLIRR